jgi:hypothetical protein
VATCYNFLGTLKGLYSEEGTQMGSNPLFYNKSSLKTNLAADAKYSTDTRKAILHSIGIVTGYGYGLIKSREYDSFTGIRVAPDTNPGLKIYRETNWSQHNRATYDDVDFTGVTVSRTVARADGVDPESTSTNTSYLCINDPLMTTGGPYTVACAAFGGRAWGAVIREDIRNFYNDPVSYFDPTTRLTPANLRTATENGYAVSYYIEGGKEVATCWHYWPPYSLEGVVPPVYISANAALARTRGTNQHVTYGPAGSGVLRANRTYEFTYAFYNKITGSETNVGAPAKVTMPNVDFTYLTLYRRELILATTVPAETVNWESAVKDPFGGQFSVIRTRGQVNHIKIRVYYRELGTFEWLPAAEIDAAELFFNPRLDILYACKDPLALSLGGQPGGFNDYSPLPDDDWIDCVEFKSRVFWFSQRQMTFSRRNDVFSYPINNFVSVPSGVFRGGIVHSFLGQADQDARLIVFTDKAQYSGTFRGVGFGQTVAIPVSPDTSANFELDGSDFYLDFRSSFTAFSARSATVADGVLYFWGAEGVFADNGVDLPRRISVEVDRFIRDEYPRDDFYQKAISCVYSSQSYEVIWFYRKEKPIPTQKALVYNVRTRKFYYYQFQTNENIWWAQEINVKTSSNGTLVSGKRIVLGTGATPTGAIYGATFDYKNTHGDDTKGSLVSEIKKNATAEYWDFILPTSMNDVLNILTDSVAGDTYTLINCAESNQTTKTLVDHKGVIVAVDKPNYKITVKPYATGVIQTGTAGATVFSSTDLGFATTVNRPLRILLHRYCYIDYKIESKYWCPAGMKFWGWWKFCHFIFKVNVVAGSTVSTLFSHRPAQTEAASASYTLSLTPNCDGYHQILRYLSAENQSSEGQGLRFTLSGRHTESEWTLQYLRAEVIPQPSGELAIFEG